MSYIAFDLDALNKAPHVARALGCGEDAIIGGLARLWAYCFRETTDHVTTLHVLGLFGVDAASALGAFGFLAEVDGDKWRVKGAERYLRVQDGRRRGGLASKGNLKQFRNTENQAKTHLPPAQPAKPVPVPEVSRTPAGTSAGGKPDNFTGLTPALTPNTEHPLSSSSYEEEQERPNQKQKAESPEDLQEIWNREKPAECPQWREMTKARRKAAAARLKERPLAEWEAVVKRIANSSFCRGKNERGWKADVDFLLRPDTAAKVLEGKYDDRPKGAPATKSQRIDITKTDPRMYEPESLEEQLREAERRMGLGARRSVDASPPLVEGSAHNEVAKFGQPRSPGLMLVGGSRG